jgi:arylsulfatase A-like enzyme
MQVPSLEPYAAEDWPAPEKAKAAMITRMDRDIGSLLEQLQRLRVESNTVVFFSSDNGPHSEGGADAAFFASAGPLRGKKRDLSEGGIRVPMIARWPGRIPAGVVSEHVWTFWDFLPTAAELAGAKVPEGIDGLSIVPALFGRPAVLTHEFLYWEFHERGSKQAVRMGDWKAIRQRLSAPLELYHLKTDLGETNNVAKAHPEVVARIEAYLKTARTESERWPLREIPRTNAAPRRTATP